MLGGSLALVWLARGGAPGPDVGLSLAADEFNPSEEAVLRAASQLARVRGAELGLAGPAPCAVSWTRRPLVQLKAGSA